MHHSNNQNNIHLAFKTAPQKRASYTIIDIEVGQQIDSCHLMIDKRRCSTGIGLNRAYFWNSERPFETTLRMHVDYSFWT